MENLKKILNISHFPLESTKIKRETHDAAKIWSLLVVGWRCQIMILLLATIFNFFFVLGYSTHHYHSLWQTCFNIQFTIPVIITNNTLVLKHVNLVVILISTMLIYWIVCSEKMLLITSELERHGFWLLLTWLPVAWISKVSTVWSIMISQILLLHISTELVGSMILNYYCFYIWKEILKGIIVCLILSWSLFCKLLFA